MNPAYQSAFDCFARLSEGDKSCLAELLRMGDGQQLTSQNSAHDHFYRAIQALGWSEPADHDPQIGRYGAVAAWQLTAAGRANLPSFTLAAEIRLRRRAHEADWGRWLTILAGKFAAGYIVVQVIAGLSVYGLTKLGVDIPAIQSVMSPALVISSCMAGIWSSITPWRRNLPASEDLLQIGLLEANSAHLKSVCLVIACPVFVFHLALEQLRVVITPEHAADLLGNQMTRAAVMTAIVCLGCWWFFPWRLEALTDQKFGRYSTS